MSAVGWLNSEAFTHFGQHIKWSDMIGNTVGLVALALGWRRSIWTWPAQLVSGVILLAAFAFSGFVYVIYGALVLWGMRDWWLRTRTPALEGATA
ncbi:hypothetical protein [Streptomyces sp. NPDC005181]|uniref:hypothetical protein n=1 Tax=Streptomyces sp. NPDC005181 TaxID=3156869 RepID=UPI0033BB6634